MIGLPRPPKLTDFVGPVHVLTWIPPEMREMGDIVNLRNARKRAKKRDAEVRANANRVAHGRPKSEMNLTAAQRDKAKRELDAHRLGGDDA